MSGVSSQGMGIGVAAPGAQPFLPAQGCGRSWQQPLHQLRPNDSPRIRFDSRNGKKDIKFLYHRYEIYRERDNERERER